MIKSFNVFRICLFTFAVIFLAKAQADMYEQSELVIREPATVSNTLGRDHLIDLSGKVSHFIDHSSVVVVSRYTEWNVGDIVAIESQFQDVGVIAFLEVRSIKKSGPLRELKCTLLRSTRKNFVQIGDNAFRVDLTQANEKYRGATELLVSKSEQTISSKYYHLVNQGVSIGETAQTLQKDEMLATWYSAVSYGVSDNLMLGTLLLGNLAGAPNVNGKWRFFSSESNIFSLGLNVAKIPTDPRTTVNATLYWDSISSGSVISHTYLSLALLSFENAKDTTAIKAFGSSSIQSGYEFIQDDWNRILAGPVYNFENKAVGGYLGYMKIWDRFHFLFAINSTNISKFEASTKDGYFFFFDAYWRF